MPYFERVATDPVRPWLPPKFQTPMVQPVAVVDVAWAIGESLEREEAVGEVYALGGPEAMTWPTMLETLRDAIPGTKKAVAPKGLPAPAALMMAKVAGAVGLGELLPFGESEPVMGSEDSVCGVAKAREQLGFEPVSLAAAAAAYGAMV
jgi:nucleoside-diphosphate-sugar epimerase